MSDLLQPRPPAEKAEIRRVPAEEYLELLVSRRTLKRTYDPHRRVRGLTDVRSGVRYYCEDRRLARAR